MLRRSETKIISNFNFISNVYLATNPSKYQRRLFHMQFN